MPRQYIQSSIFEPEPFVFRCGRLNKALEHAMVLSEAQRRPAYVLSSAWNPLNTGGRYVACLRMDLSSVVAKGYRVLARVDSQIRWKAPARTRRLG